MITLAGLDKIEFDDVGTVTLAKDWGESQVFRLRRASDRQLTKNRYRKENPPKTELADLLPNVAGVYDQGTYGKELETLLKLFDNSIEPQIIRSNWHVTASYKWLESSDRDTIQEELNWMFNLKCVGESNVSYPLSLISSEDLEAVGGLRSLHRIGDQGEEESIFDASEDVGVDEQMIRHRTKPLTIRPNENYRIELRYRNKWPVNKDMPIIHNTFMPRENCTNSTRLILEGDFTDASVLLGNPTGEVEASEVGENGNIYNIPPLIRGTGIEIILKFY